MRFASATDATTGMILIPAFFHAAIYLARVACAGGQRLDSFIDRELRQIIGGSGRAA